MTRAPVGLGDWARLTIRTMGDKGRRLATFCRCDSYRVSTLLDDTDK